LGTVNGFHEFDAFIHPKHDPPWWGACSLSGYGVQPETFDTAFAYVGADRMRAWWDVVTKIYPQWYDPKKPYPAGTIYGGNSCYVTIPFIFLNLYLGTEDAKLIAWSKDSEGNWAGNFQAPNVFAEILSRHCPIQIAEWGRCTFDQARYQPDANRAEVVFANAAQTGQNVVFACEIVPEQILLDGQPCEAQKSTDRWGKRLIAVTLAPGRHELAFTFPNAR